MRALEQEYNELSDRKQAQVHKLASALKTEDDAQIRNAQVELKAVEDASSLMRDSARVLIKKADPTAEANDTNYIFLHFVVHNLPKGLVGLLIAIIFLASWGSIAAALNSLASTTMVDVYQRMINPHATDGEYLRMSKIWTLIWGVFSIAVAQFATGLGSLIEAVNILGSLFYGTILGIFVVAFMMKQVKGNAAFWGALVAELLVITIYMADVVSFLWLNVIGCVLVMLIAFIWQMFDKTGAVQEQ
jgi:Na+/proline symporter